MRYVVIFIEEALNVEKRGGVKCVMPNVGRILRALDDFTMLLISRIIQLQHFRHESDCSKWFHLGCSHEFGTGGVDQPFFAALLRPKPDIFRIWVFRDSSLPEFGLRTMPFGIF
ncbi:hypothetical protein WJ35_05335 [Burkholderia ubonensis]|uniref:Uncharacterized protein n=1 Tax=Burkholderia ubonensis TaxID=101571 RepID=A0A1B4LBI9_9BURK|nr:hypothetical protein WJ35_05335 [Burkholderia ubonensis]AOK09867.1 hypothetical protein WK31_06175 [Burkholderia vietnamiensis]KVE22816.1 hypothetical protein WI92_21250 [Burkholderia vietnamiensis]KVF09002.1 hypothetical protein WJ04_09240 [Burkholderia vietnamiensis]